MFSESNIVIQVQKFTEKYLNDHSREHLSYHNLEHTQYVVNSAQQIAQHSNLNADEEEILMLAAWLHDTGYTELSQGHEAVSQKIAQEFLEKAAYDADKTKQVLAAIEATKVPQEPNTRVEKILCDADLFHLADKNFIEICQPLRIEWETERGSAMSDLEWLEINQRFLLSHQYQSAYGQAELEGLKKKNLKGLNKQLKKLRKKKDEALVDEMGIPPEDVKQLKKKLEKVKGRPERGVETVFRITSKNHLNLSSMADSKANILISVNTIIISVIITVLIQKLDTNPHLILPTFLLLSTCVISVVFAILATRPNVSSGKFTRDDVQNRQTNLLFFGNFHKMKMQDYEWGMKELLEDADYLYGSLIRDIYFLGKVLGKKYKLLRDAYTIFMFGLVISVVSFVVVSVPFIFNPRPKKSDFVPTQVISPFKSDSTAPAGDDVIQE